MGTHVHLICKKQERYFAMSCHSIVHALNKDKNHGRAKEDMRKRKRTIVNGQVVKVHLRRFKRGCCRLK